jgi:hypothetical protein
LDEETIEGGMKMGMTLELNTMIVTKGNEKRKEDNEFELVKEGYRLYPIDIPVEVRKTIHGEVNGMAKIVKLTWGDNHTVLTYKLFALNSTN